MGPRFCSFCGQPVVAGAAFCASCGAALGGAPPLSGTPGGPMAGIAWLPGPPIGFGSGNPFPGMPTPGTRGADLKGLEKVFLAAIATLVGGISSIAVFFIVPISALVGSPSSSEVASFTVSNTWFYVLVSAAAVGLVITLVELVLFRQGFRALATHDSRFSTPASLVLVMLLAIAALAAGGGAFVYLLFRDGPCFGTGTAFTASCVNLGNFVALLAVVAIAGIAYLVGFIGLLVGIWRLGTRFGEGLFKAAAVLILIPGLNIVGMILLLVAAHSTRQKLRSAQFNPTFA